MKIQKLSLLQIFASNPEKKNKNKKMITLPHANNTSSLVEI